MRPESSIIFLDIDGVLNCQLLFEERQISKKSKQKEVKKDQISRLEYYQSMLCPKRVKWLNSVCEETKADVVLSSSWRIGKTVQEMQDILDSVGATFKIISFTPNLGYARGVEIYEWLKKSIIYEVHGYHYFNFRKYVIIDDDSDMLLNQAPHFFQTDAYSGLTPNLCFRIKQFLKLQVNDTDSLPF